MTRWNLIEGAGGYVQEDAAGEYYKADEVDAKVDALKADNGDLEKAIKACISALRSYQYGNCSSELAESIADMAQNIVNKVEARK